MMMMTTKIAAIPCPIKSSDALNVLISILLEQTRDQAQDDTACDDAGDLTGNVGSHRVHQEVVLRIRLLAHALDDSSRHREG